MTNYKVLLQQAHDLFSAGEYDKALFLYAQVSSLYPSNAEYQLYAIFCDVATENAVQGQALFDYFAVGIVVGILFVFVQDLVISR